MGGCNDRYPVPRGLNLNTRLRPVDGAGDPLAPAWCMSDLGPRPPIPSGAPFALMPDASFPEPCHAALPVCLRVGARPMKLLTEYLERAVQLENLAAQEANPDVKAKLKEQAEAYRKLAAKRAEELGLPPPSKSRG